MLGMGRLRGGTGLRRAACGVGHVQRWRRSRSGQHREFGRDGGDRVAGLIQIEKSSGDALEKRAAALNSSHASPYSPRWAFAHLAARCQAINCWPVADAQHGRAELEDGGVDLRAPVLVHAGRAAGNDDAAASLQLGGLDLTGPDLAVNA